jgi:ATP-dependent Clp protease ATP-binding subunit ClpA
MYPFERFTERAKKVLTLAQEEAEKAHHSYIGTEHLLVGLLREEGSLAALALRNLGIEIGEVRRRLEAALAADPTIVVRQIVPTARVKKVIETAFEEARRIGDTYVGTEHLLLGLLVEREGLGAQVLIQMGATLERVRTEIERLLREVGQEESSPGPARVPRQDDVMVSPRLAALLQQAREEAAARGAPVVGLEHLLRALTDDAGFEALTRVLDQFGVGWKPPEELVQLSATLLRVQRQKAEAIAQQNYEAAARLRAQEKQLINDYQLKEASWLQSLRRQEPPPAKEA